MVALFFSSCTNDAIDSLSGEYPVPTDVTLNTVASQSDAKRADGASRLFNLKLTGENNAAFNVQFCCSNSWYLEARTYTIASSSTAMIGNFVSDNTSFSSNSSSASISDGTITVTKTDALVYTIYGVFVMSDKSVVRVHYEGNINYVEPVPEKFTQVLSAKATAATGYSTIELLLGTDGVSLMSSAWGAYVAGTGSYVYLDLISASSTLTAGTYTPVASGSEAVGTFTIGYKASYGSWTWDAGSRYYTATNNVPSAATYLTSGSVKVVLSGGTYIVTIDSGSVYARYSGAITVN